MSGASVRDDTEGVGVSTLAFHTKNKRPAERTPQEVKRDFENNRYQMTDKCLKVMNKKSKKEESAAWRHAICSKQKTKINQLIYDYVETKLRLKRTGTKELK